MPKNYCLTQLDSLDIQIQKPCLIFLYGDLGAGKTTISQHIISQYFTQKVQITSPTYVYYNKYDDIYHFDLYRVQDYDEFISIGGEEILDNNQGIILVEWPEILEKYYSPDIKICIEKTDIPDERSVEITYN